MVFHGAYGKSGDTNFLFFFLICICISASRVWYGRSSLHITTPQNFTFLVLLTSPIFYGIGDLESGLYFCLMVDLSRTIILYDGLKVVEGACAARAALCLLRH